MPSYAPAVDSNLTVRLPGEFMRCKVVKAVDRNRVVIEISGVPVSKLHVYRKGDVTGARRRVEYGRDVWEALDDRDFLADRSPLDVVEPKPEVKAAPKKRKAVAKKKAKAKAKAKQKAA